MKIGQHRMNRTEEDQVKVIPINIQQMSVLWHHTHIFMSNISAQSGALMLYLFPLSNTHITILSKTNKLMTKSQKFAKTPNQASL